MPGAIRKAKLVARETIAAVTSPRTPKAATLTSPQSSGSTSITSPPTVRRRGRPPKKTPEKAAEDSASSDVEDSSSFLPDETNDSGEDFEDASKVQKKSMAKKAPKAVAVKAVKEKEKPSAGSGRKEQALRHTSTPAPVSTETASQEDDDGSLFEIIKVGKSALQAVVDDWIDTYKKDKDKGMMELMQFFVQSSGCRGRITPNMYHGLEHSELIRKMTEEFDEESCSYPLVTTGPQWRRFRSGFCELVGALVRRCQHSILFDEFLADRLINFLTGLADSQVRAFRHTSTLAVMKLTSALVDVALYVRANLDGTRQQQESERLRQAGGRRGNGDRGDALAAKEHEWQQNMEEIKNMMMYIFKGVFVHRYRDVVPDIRCICITEIGYWMKKLPALFLEDSYLKYVGWTLFDKVGEVRLTCLRILQPLYEAEELATNMALFTNRFKDRIVEMTLDKEYDVAVAAVKLVTSILTHNEQVLTDKDCENVYELVYSSHRGVAQAAGEFLNAKIFKVDLDSEQSSSVGGGSEQTPPARSKRARRRNPHAPLVRDLVLFFIESELHEHAAYLVDSLWELGAMLKDWQCMTDLLLEEPARGEEALDDKQESCLIEIMRCCVRQAATGEYPVGRGPATRKLTAKEQKQVQEDKVALTEHFIVALPLLLSKYSTDAEKVANLLQIAVHFDLELYTTSRQEKQLVSLLKQIEDIVEKHVEAEVLEWCARVIEYMCNEEAAICGRAEVAKGTLLDNIVSRYTAAYSQYFDMNDKSEDAKYALFAAVRRVHAFAHCVSVAAYDLWDSVVHILRVSNDTDSVPHEVVCSVIAIGQCLLLWQLSALDTKNPDKANMKKLRKQLTEQVALLQELLYHPQEKITDAAYITACDLLVVFGRQLATLYPPLAPLALVPDKNLQTQLGAFLTERVFVDDDDDGTGEDSDKVELLHSRRNFLACFAKLVVYNIVSIVSAADMFKNYTRFYDDYGDIIKSTLSKAREISKIVTAKTLAVSLTKLYREVAEEQGGRVVRGSDAFLSVKELARRFALSFGLDQVKNREAVVALHREGIVFSLQADMAAADDSDAPANLAFFEVLGEFTSKLIKQDKKAVVAFLDKHLRDSAAMASADVFSAAASHDSAWQPLLAYRGALIHDHDLDSRSVLTAASSVKSTATGRGSRTSRKKDSIDSVVTDGSFRTPAPRRGGEPLTSTAVKRRRLDADASSSLSATPGSETDFETRSRLANVTIPEEEEDEPEADGESIEEFSSPRSRRTPRRTSSAAARAAAKLPSRLVEEEEEEATLIEEHDSDLEQA